MRRVAVADAKARLSAVLAEVEAGREVIITRRGRAIARLIPEPVGKAGELALEELFAFVDAQPMHAGPDAGEQLRGMRNAARY